jgi:quinohemoprotein ethanol dehydrogenase
MPGAIGGHNWHSMSYSKKTGLMYIPVIKGLMQYAQPEDYKHNPHHQNIGTDLSSETLINPQFMQTLKEKSTRGELLAWNPETQTAEWSYTHATGWNGGVLSTAGDVVFQGTADQKFMAFDANSGAVLWQYNTKLGIVAAPISYSVDGEQYVAIVAKWGGGYPLAVGVKPPKGLDNGRLLVFKLGGQARLPEPDMPTLLMANKPQAMTITDAAALKEGAMKYLELCSGCHGSDGIAGGNVPDLRYRASQYPFETFKLFVLEGVRASQGMVGFKDVLDETGANKIYNYILRQAHIEYDKNQNKGVLQDMEFLFYDALATFFVAAATRTTGFYVAIASFWGTIICLIVVVLRRRKKHKY